MKQITKYLKLLLFLGIPSIPRSQAQVSITDEQLDSFSYGADEFKLAIIGDSGTEKEAKKVMELTKFDALLHLGDYDYSCLPDKYFEKILDTDRKYQFMGVLGNHEGISECGEEINKRFLNNVYNEMTSSSKNSQVSCEFSSSKWMWSCKYKNVRIIGLTSGVNGGEKAPEQLSFLKKHLSVATEDWKICAWHFYDDYYHTGKYQDHDNIISKKGESFYDYCKDHGAIIFSAHDHVYARTRVMSLFKEPVIDKYDKDTGEDIVQIRNGATIDILNGAGGYEMYIEQGEQKDYKHWQKKYAKGDNGENEKRFGGLFCHFNVGGNNRKTYCEFLRINSSNKVFDTFTIYRNDDPGTIPYSQIDTDFKNEKLIAYKTANNIVDPIVDQTSNATNTVPPDAEVNQSSSNTESNKNKFQSFKDKYFTKANLIIGGSVVAAIVIVLSLGLLLFKKNNKKVEDDALVVKTPRKEEKDDTFTFFPETVPPSSSYPTLDDASTQPLQHQNSKIITSNFEPLPIPKDSNFYGRSVSSRAAKTYDYANGQPTPSPSTQSRTPYADYHAPSDPYYTTAERKMSSRNATAVPTHLPSSSRIPYEKLPDEEEREEEEEEEEARRPSVHRNRSYSAASTSRRPSLRNNNQGYYARTAKDSTPHEDYTSPYASIRAHPSLRRGGGEEEVYASTPTSSSSQMKRKPSYPRAPPYVRDPAHSSSAAATHPTYPPEDEDEGYPSSTGQSLNREYYPSSQRSGPRSYDSRERPLGPRPVNYSSSSRPPHEDYYSHHYKYR